MDQNNENKTLNNVTVTSSATVGELQGQLKRLKFL
jgi:hypothetical protein